MNYIKDNEGCYTVICGGESHTFNGDHINFQHLVNSLKLKDEISFLTHINGGRRIQNWACGKFNFKNGHLFYKDKMIHDVITNRIINMIDNKINHMPIMNFLENLHKNPSFYIIEKIGLYDFLQHKQLPITDDGCFIAQKSVKKYVGSTVTVNNGELKNGDLTDIYTGGIRGMKSYRNNIGDICRMNRNMVQSNREMHCSNGLHVGSSDYVRTYPGSDIILVKVNPKDVVSIPTDCSCQKLRCCEYKVLSLYSNKISSCYYGENNADN